MKFKETKIKDNYLVYLNKKNDNRGFFARYFCVKDFSKKKLNTKWVQINNSLTYKVGTLRGLHFQKKPNEEVKLVRCVRGSIWDVVVDLRKNSKTFGKWYGEKLTEINRKMMYVPKGFAHGFVSFESNTEILYLVSDYYAPGTEGTLIWNDPNVGIDWPTTPQIISDKDAKGDKLDKITPIKLKN